MRRERRRKEETDRSGCESVREQGEFGDKEGG